MSVVINTNVDSIRIQHGLTDATNNLSTAMQRMSTGLKVLSAKDDAAGTVIAARMDVQLSGNKIAQNNVENANAMLSTAEGSLDVVQSNLSRIRDLTLQAKNGTYSEEEIKAMDDEVQALVKEIDRVGTASKYSSLQLFGGTELAKGATFQVGANSSEDNTITADASLFKAVAFSTITGIKGKYSLAEIAKGTAKPVNDFKVALDDLDKGIDDITDRKSVIGAAQNRLTSALETLTIQQENLSSAKSIIKDADIAEEASSFVQSQILQQVGTSLLAQANQAPSIALSLI